VRLGAILSQARPDELVAVAEAGVTEVRLAVRWADVQPAAGRWSGQAMEALESAVRVARASGLGPWLALLGRDTPPWFEDEGGFADAKTAGRWWPRYVEGVAERVGDTVAGWFPMVGPTGFAAEEFAGRDEAVAAAGRRTLLVSWRDAWRVLRGGPPVATALTLDPWDGEWPRALRTGEPVPDGLELDELAGACDLLGGLLAVSDSTSAEEPAERLVRLAAEGPDRPVAELVTLAGAGDEERARAAEIVIASVGLTVDDGVDVQLVFADPLLDADGAPAPAADVLSVLARPSN
jgi:hypothetical protein